MNMPKITISTEFPYAKKMCYYTLKWLYDTGIYTNSEESLTIIFDGQADCPDFKSSNLTGKENEIRLSLKNDTKWNQVLYQLTHEICHYVIYVQNKTNYHFCGWIEESICEAFSLFCLYLWAVEWNAIGFKCNKDYGKHMYSYMTHEIDKNNTEPCLTKHTTIEELKIINSHADTDRTNRHSFMKELTSHISSKNMMGLVNYQKYMKSDLLLDTDRYIADYPNNTAVKYICKAQKHIEEHTND